MIKEIVDDPKRCEGNKKETTQMNWVEGKNKYQS